MEAKSNESIDLLSIFLTGIPGLEDQHGWLSIPFFIMYIVAIVGNSLIMAAVQSNPALHEPMYLFLSMLAVTEVGVSLSTLPTVLGILWFDARRIDFDGCLAQMFFIHTFSCMESGVLFAMSYDRFVAIYNPLRYTAILTLPRIISMGLSITVKSVALMAPLPVLLRQLPYCHTNVLSHSYCLHSDLIQLPCAHTKLNSILGLAIVLATFGLDSLLIMVSYVLILCTVLSISSGEGRWKALNTCVSHICAVLVYYVPMIGVSVMHRAAKHASPIIHTLMSSIYLFVPPVLNPIIYSVKTQPIREGIVTLFSSKRELF
ncbi:olfactory receptor 639 [Oryctolagus cuniculus]|uniref:Olfactory receptor n=1 Tax=Oryctolagus cuniculus TaxID=9986 RepID=B8K183_RABIT|nr:olfactory receptor 639 [Oryctolagus cuniculus]ACK77556.1 olfactory receptor 639 (predicted) [Oryctolagus cuniculus]